MTTTGPHKVDLIGFKSDIDQIKKRLEKEQGQADIEHYYKIRRWADTFAVIGTLSLWTPTSWLLAPLCLAIAVTARWTILAHHTCHGGFDYTKEPSLNRRVFAVGSLRRRFLDWFDWMLPEAWNIEHNILHHYHLSELDDPDLLEENMRILRNFPIPTFLKIIPVLLIIVTWKWSYYASNTFKHLIINEDRKGMHKFHPVFGPYMIFHYVLPGYDSIRFFPRLLYQVMLPYAIYKFGIFPLPWLILGYLCGVGNLWYNRALYSCFLAEIIANIHSFVIIAPNHAGGDLYRFEGSVQPFTGDFYLRQILASVNFSAGNDIVDFAHGWLNYQIEHHLFPSMTMLSYRKAMPMVKEVCAKHGIPYIQESVWKRLYHTIRIMIGLETMKQFSVTPSTNQ